MAVGAHRPILSAVRPPSVDALTRAIADTGLPHPLLVDAARAAIAAAGEGDPAAGPGGDRRTDEAYVDAARAEATARARALLQPVVNATGVLLHTNLGRAPVEVHQPPTYANLELDLVTGRRGSRSGHAGSLLARACGAEDALVVNNGAAAVLLALAALAGGRAVAVSRGELVEIGGGFRIPEVLAQSGAHLVEVGTTNRTRIEDYADAVAGHGDGLAAVLKVHPSNYRIEGFTDSVPIEGLRGLGPPVVADLGSGLLDARCPWLAGGPPPWLRGEPGVRQALDDGAGLVTFSGDKLLGGPQAGIIAGRRDLVARCARHPLARALRPGGLVLTALQGVALAYLRRDGDAVPLWRMATAPISTLEVRAAALPLPRGAQVVPSVAMMGGGTLPGVELPSVGIVVPGDHTARLRAGSPPTVARVSDDGTVLDLRTVLPDQDGALAAALRALPGPDDPGVTAPG
jgi:L-seryl-tRNA(Ser) seleniumtransferase